MIALEINTRRDIRENYWDITDKTLRMRIDQLTNTIISHTIKIQNSICRAILTEGKRKSNDRNIGASQTRKRKIMNRLREIESKIDRGSSSEVNRLRFKAERLKRNIIYELEKPLLKMTNITKENEIWEILRQVESINRGCNDSVRRQSVINTINSQEEIEIVADSKFNKIGSVETCEDISSDQELSISIFETENAIHRVRGKKFTGPEGLKFSVFNKLLEFSTYRKIIHTWASMCFKSSYIPSDCRLTSGKLIPKKAKGQFRIVHLCHPLLMVLEQIALTRLEYRLEQNDLYSARQFGFKAQRSRHDLLARILERCIEHQLNSDFAGRTYIISLDIKGAFDNVNQTILKNKIIRELTPDPIRYWVANFVQNRRIQVKFKDFTSKERIIDKGVPQRSSLGPILWNLAINQIDADFKSDYETFEELAYADDIYIIYNGINRQDLQKKMDRLIDRISDLKLEVEPSKCCYIAIDFSTEYSLIDSRVKIYNEYIKKVDKMSILGVPVNHKLKLGTTDERIN